MEDTLHFYRLAWLDSSAVWSDGVAGLQCQQRRGRQGAGRETNLLGAVVLTLYAMGTSLWFVTFK
jgi:hypothetical protein